MKIVAKFKDVLTNIKNESILSLIVSDYRHKTILQELDPTKTYSVEIKEIKSKRTLAQNRYMWALLHEIDVAMHGRATDEFDIYVMCLERANVKSEIVYCVPQAEQILRHNFRAVKFISKYDDELNAYKVFYGSSKMDTKEMSELIDTILDVAEQVGIETDSYWREVLK